MAILRQHRQNQKIQSLDDTSPTNKQNGNLVHTDGVQTDASTKDERIITSGGVPKNGKNPNLVENNINGGQILMGIQ
jgi:hypothetical protein